MGISPSHLIVNKVRKAVGALPVLETTEQPTKCIMHLIVYQSILCVCVCIYIFLWTICIGEVYILIYTPLLYVNYNTSIRYSWIINDCKLILGYMCGKVTQDKWKPTSVTYVTSRTSQRTPKIVLLLSGYWQVENCTIVDATNTTRVGRWRCLWELQKSITCLSVKHTWRFHSSVAWKSDAYSV